VTTWRDLFLETIARLGGPKARAEARWLCEAASGYQGDEWAEGLAQNASSRGVARLDAMVERRLAGEPLAYVLGSWSFRSLDLFVDRRVLIPRPETELVAGVAIELARTQPRPIVVADLGTGSGAIGLSMATELPITGVEVWCTDVSADACAVARANLAGIGRAAANVRVAEGSWFDALPDECRGRLAVAVANPPYIAEGDPDVEPSVVAWEPHDALWAGPDGLDAVRVLVAGAREWLQPGGWLVLEIGAGQGTAAAELAAAARLVSVDVRPDLSGRDRILVASRS